jgi:hypothetical protein
MPLLETLATSSFGSLLGMRHALEPDHLTAVSTLVSRERSGYRAALLGVCWGIGHTLSLVVMGAALVVLRYELPAPMSDVFELLVAAMLVVLGLRAIAQARRLGPAGPLHVHRHGRIIHRHSGVRAHLHVGTWTLARRPLLVGAIHGLAGSGAITALVLTTLPSTATRLIYMTVFGLGSTLSMAALSGLLGWPLARFGTDHTVARGVSLLVGCVSTTLGLWWGYPLITRLL